MNGMTDRARSKMPLHGAYKDGFVDCMRLVVSRIGCFVSNRFKHEGLDYRLIKERDVGDRVSRSL